MHILVLQISLTVCFTYIESRRWGLMHVVAHDWTEAIGWAACYGIPSLQHVLYITIDTPVLDYNRRRASK
jgi:hypothetical protein